MAFDAERFLRTHGTHRTALTVAGRKVNMVGRAKDYTVEGLSSLARSQDKAVRLVVAKTADDVGRPVTEKVALEPDDLSAFVEGDGLARRSQIEAAEKAAKKRGKSPLDADADALGAVSANGKA